MFQLDVRTVVTVNSAYTAVITFFLLFFGYRSFRRLSGLNWWAYGYILFTASFLILGLRHLVPPVIPDTVPHFLTVLGFLFIKQGLARFYSSRGRLWADGLLLLGAAIGLVSVSGRAVSSRVLVIVLCALAAYSLTLLMVWRETNTITLKYLYILAGLIQLARLWIGLRLPASVDPMQAGNRLAIVSMLFFVSLMFISLALVSITVRRLLVERENLLEKEKVNAITDELTGLLNRRGFKAVYTVEEKRSTRKKLPMSLVMADIDGFKAINDRYGHDFGDEVLKFVADVFRQEFRGGDILARWGGEEFLIVQPETAAESCRTALERARQAVARQMFRPGGDTLHVTVSFGFHTAVAGELGFGSHLKQADDNMYEAKSTGRNRVIGTG